MSLRKQPKNAKGKLKVSELAGICMLLVAVTLAVYWPVLRFDFVNFDDPYYVESNVHVQTGLTLPTVAWAFSTKQTANWHPLTWLSLMLDVNLFGRGASGSHVTNLLFHLANTMLVFLLLRSMTRATWRSAFVAALFALHPLHVESVAWISERKDVLNTFFGLLSLIAYSRYVPSDKWQVMRADPASSPATRHRSLHYFLALFFFALALMSKPMLVTLPFVMLLLDWWPLGRMSRVEGRESRIRHLVVEKIPFFALSAISCGVTYFVQQKSGAVASLVKISLAGRIENAFISYGRYLGKTFWPVNLAVLYPHPLQWDTGLIVLSLLLVIGLSATALGLGRRLPFVFTGWFWFVATLVPVIGLVQVGNQSMADRYAYVPLIGVFIVLAWSMAELCANRRLPKQFVVMVALLLLAASALRSRDQTSHWRNSETLFRHTLAVTQNNFLAYNNLGTYLSSVGQMTEAMDCYAKSLQINPDYAESLCNMGNALSQSGQWQGAVEYYHRAMQIAPDHTDVLSNLGIALAAQKQFADATACFEKALQGDPDSPSAHNNLATVLFVERRFDEAARHFREALRLQPGNPQVYSNLGDTLQQLGQTAEAVRCYQEALRLNPGDPAIQARLQQALGTPASN